MELFQDKKDKKECAHDIERGCEFCGCESDEAVTKVCEGCFKLHVTDWLEDYPDNLPDDIYEVRFKNTRRGYCQNVNNLSLNVGDIVAVEASPGHDIGIVSLSGDMVAKQMKRVGFNPQNGEFKKIYRKAKPYDIEKWQEAIALEHETMIKARQIAADMNLNMKIGDVEYQGDKIKAIFYYIADERVDFRELIKVFAEVFHIRVEMKQIGARQEAGRIGGIGSCGRELCCASWISSFLSVTTNAARTQDISLNPQKLAGQCSKLKCCLVYEYDDYMDARREFPKVSEPLRIMEGEYFFVKNDILGRTMSFSTAPGSMAGLVSLPIARVREIMKLNAKGVKPDSLVVIEETVRKELEPSFVNAIGEDSITRFDAMRKKKKSRNGKTRDEGNETEPTLQSGESQPDKDGSRRERGQSGGERSNRNNRGNGATPRVNNNGGQNRRQNKGSKENSEQDGRPNGENTQTENRPNENRQENSKQQPRQNRSGNRKEGSGQPRSNGNKPEGTEQEPRQSRPNGETTQTESRSIEGRQEGSKQQPRQNRQGGNRQDGGGQPRQSRPNENKPEGAEQESRQSRQGENKTEGSAQPRQNRNNRNGRRPERKDGQPQRRESERNGGDSPNGNNNAKPQESSDKGGSVTGEKKTNE